MQRLITIGWACGGALTSKVALLARNRRDFKRYMKKEQR